MLLENGTIRTLDPSLPVVSSLWIAGERIAGGVGVHETSLPSPDTVDLGGRCVLPGFTDSHVHFPTWAVAQRDVKLDGCASLAEALDRIRAAPGDGTWLRGQGWRDADWPDGPPTRQALDAIEPERPAMLISKDYHALWLNSAALAFAGGDLEIEGGVVARDEAGEPTGVLYEEAAWQFKESYAITPEGRVRRRDARRRARRRGTRRHRVARQGRLARRDRALAAARAAGEPAAPRLAVDAGRPARATCARSACGAASALPSSGSATSRRSWTGRSARRRHGCPTAAAS